MEDAQRLDRRARRADDGAARPRGLGHAAHASARRRRRRPHARSHGRVPRGQRRGRARLRAGVRLRARAGDLDAAGRRSAQRRGDRRGPELPPAHRPRARDRGEPDPGAARPRRGRAGVLRALVGCGSGRTGERGRGRRADRRDHPLLASLARPRPDPRPSLPRPDPALRARDQGAHLHADRRDRRRAHDLAAGDPGRRAQLGLPLHLDPRHDLHAPGAAHAEPDLGGRRVHGLRRRRRADRGRIAPDHVRDRRPPRPEGVDARRAHRVRRRAAGPDRERRLRPAAERRLRRRARLDPAAHAPQPAPAEAPLATRPVAGGMRDRRVASSPTRASGRRAGSRSSTSRRS